MNDVTFNMRTNSMKVHRKQAEPWEITLVDTGRSTMTGGRLKRVSNYLDDEPFCFTYGDGVADVDITALVDITRLWSIGYRDCCSASWTRRGLDVKEAKALMIPGETSG